MTATETPTMTQKQRFTLFIGENQTAAALLATAEQTRDGTAYGVFADHLEDCGESEWASYFRTCMKGEERGLVIDGSTYHTFPVSGFKGRTVYDINRLSPRMRSRFGQSEYVYSAAELVSYFAAQADIADRKANRAAAAKVAKAEARKQPNPFKVGDILHYSYGYDATINTFAQVVKVSGQTVTYRKIGSEQVGEWWATGCFLRPVPGDFYGGEESSRLVYSASYSGTASASLPVAGHKGKHWHKTTADRTFTETDNR
jgi:hypothetical protein